MFGFISNAFHAATHFVAQNWRQILVITAAVAVGVLVTVLTGGLGAPLLVAALAGGLAAGATSYSLNWALTPDRPAWSWTGFAEATVVSGVLAVATAGVGEVLAPVASSVVSSVVPDAVSAAVPDVVSTAVSNATAGSLLGAGAQVALNAVEGKPLGDNVVLAAVVGGGTGVVAGPIAEALGHGPVLPGPRDPLTEPSAPESPTAEARSAAGELSGRSPTLRANWTSLQAEGWKMVYGQAGRVFTAGDKPYDGGSFTSFPEKLIVVDPAKGTPAAIVQTLSHELGHATTGEPARVFDPAMTRDAYVEANTAASLRSEGEATLRNAEVRSEILAATGQDIGIGGVHAGDYARIASDPDLTHAQRVDAIAQIFAHGERPSTDASAADYYDYYARGYAKAWDDRMNPPATVQSVWSSAPPSPTRGFTGALDEAH